MRVMIIPGHNESKKGCKNDLITTENMYEFDVVYQICATILKLEQSRKIDLVLKKRDTYTGLAEEINWWAPDIAIEVHLNAFNKTVQGSEVLYCAASKKGKILAAILQESFTAHLQLTDRGIKPVRRGERADGVLWDTDMPTIIVEPFFLDSVRSKAELKANVILAASAILDGIEKFRRRGQ